MSVRDYNLVNTRKQIPARFGAEVFFESFESNVKLSPQRSGATRLETPHLAPLALGSFALPEPRFSYQRVPETACVLTGFFQHFPNCLAEASLLNMDSFAV